MQPRNLFWSKAPSAVNNSTASPRCSSARPSRFVPLSQLCFKLIFTTSYTMRTFFVSSSALFGAIYANVIVPSNTPSSADPTITSAPRVNIELLRRQNDQRFMGWLSLSDGDYSSADCASGATLSQAGDYWRCCLTAAEGCDMPVSCRSGSLIYSFASTGTLQRGTYACTDIYTGAEAQSWTICNTGLLFENTQDSNARTNLFCSSESLNWSLYRAKPQVSTPAGMEAFLS